jgi:hypothetical protein
MTSTTARWHTALTWSVWLWSCQPSTLCDPGQHAIAGGCYPDEQKRDAGRNEDPADGSVDAEVADASGCSGPDPYEGFKKSCTSKGDCGCHAPDCATSPLGYCTKINCDPDDESECPPNWTCLMIPPGASPDPTITHLCLAP